MAMLGVDRLRCEYREDPIGIGEARPRFGWIIACDAQDVVQAGYRIQVARDSEFQSLLWDSGDVASGDSVGVEFGGPALAPRALCFWRVQVRDAVSRQSPWSAAARFETALDAAEWRARFISPESDQDAASSKGMLLRKGFTLSGDVAGARIYASALGLYELCINGKHVGNEILAPGWTSYGKRLLFQTYDVTDLLRRAEVHEPHFTYMGFRYLAVDEWPGNPDPGDFTAIAVYSDMEETGSFESSNPLLNRLHANILWGLKGNFVDVPTDCPQRDERLGWTGDAQVFIGTAAFLMGTDPFYRKWLRDLTADQLESGGVPFVIPNVLEEKKAPDGSVMPVDSSTGWGDAATRTAGFLPSSTRA